MQRIIIWEGADGCGKSSMAQELSRLSGVPYFKNEAEHDHFLSNPTYFRDALRYVDTYFANYLEASGAEVILDRAWPSEWVYPKIMGRQTDERVLSWLDAKHAQLGTVIINPYRTDYSALEDYDVIKDNIHEIDRLYEDFTRWTKCRVIRFCVDGLSLEDEMAILRSHKPEIFFGESYVR